MKPTVGRIVHYRVTPDAAPQAAIITAVGAHDRCNLTVFPAAGNSFPVYSIPPRCEDRPAEDPLVGGCWEWPPRANA